MPDLQISTFTSARNMNSFDYIAVFDVDELLVPSDPSLGVPQMLDNLAEEGSVDSFVFERTYFPKSYQGSR